jgi:hypothetical protein
VENNDANNRDSRLDLSAIFVKSILGTYSNLIRDKNHMCPILLIVPYKKMAIVFQIQ